jgi:hypothetical protein
MGHDAHIVPFAFQNRPLFNVQLEIGIELLQRLWIRIALPPDAAQLFAEHRA